MHSEIKTNNENMYKNKVNTAVLLCHIVSMVVDIECFHRHK